MPTVRYGQRKVDLAPLPGVRKTAAATPGSEGAGLAGAQAQAAAIKGRSAEQKAAAIAGFGGTVAGAGVDMFAKLQAQEREKADNVALLAAKNQLARWETDRIYDPEKGALTHKGKDAMGLPEQVDQDFVKVTGEIEKGLNSRQLAQFQKIKGDANVNIHATVQRHVFGEMQAYAKDELQARIETGTNLIVANAAGKDFRRVSADMQDMTDDFLKNAPSLGLGPAGTKEGVDRIRGAVHSQVIDRLLRDGSTTNGKPDAALYYEEAKGQITDAGTRDKIESALASASVATTGLHTSEALWQQFGPKGDNDPINLDAMETAAREKFKDDPKSLQSTIQMLRERKAGVDASRQDRKEETAGTLWGNVNKGASLQQIQRSPEYLRAPGALQLQVTQHIVKAAEDATDRSYQLGERASATVRRQENDKENAGWAMLWHYDDPAILSQMSDNQVLALTPDLGIEHVNRLMTKKRAIGKNDDTVRAATIDEDLFKSTAQGAGLNAYGTQTESDKAALGRLRNVAETAIDHEQQLSGKSLTRDRKQAIMRGIVDQKVMLDDWGTDTETIAATVVNPSDRAAAYVPIAKIPGNVVSDYLNYARGLSPAMQRMSDTELRSRFSGRIQRAYGLRVIGATRAEIEAAMQGSE